MTENIGLLLAFLSVLVPYNITGEFSCYECLRVPSPRDCDRIVRCSGNDSVCYVEQVVSHNGVILFNMGCRQDTRCYGNIRSRSIGLKGKIKNWRRDSDRHGETTAGIFNVMRDENDGMRDESEGTDLTVCEECCRGDFCNSYGCTAKPLPPRDQRGPVCFNCHQQSGEDTCDQLSVCDHGQMCFMSPFHTGTNAKLFTTSCIETTNCMETPELAIGRRNVIACSGCCADDYCNRNCSALKHHINSVTHIDSHVQTSSSTQFSTATYSSTHYPTSTMTRQSSVTTGYYIPTINRNICELFKYTFNEQYNKCYKVYNNKYKDMLPWQQARDRCNQDGGDLIVFEESGQETYFAALEEKLNHLDLPRFWVGATDLNSAGAWQWLDSRSVNVSFFHPGEPNDSQHKGEHCAALAQFVIHGPIAMNDDRCEVRTNFICEISARALQPTVPTSQQPLNCRNPDYKYLPNIGMCYKIYDDVMKTQTEARAVCKNEHSDLLVLRNNTVEHIFQEMHFYSQNEHLRYWLGGERIPDHTANKFDSFRWLNGRTLNPGLQWFPGEPNNYNNFEDCLTFTYFNNKDVEFALNDDHCSFKYYFICEEKCPDASYQYFPSIDLCIKVYNERVTWSEARVRCGQDKTDLLELDSMTSLQFLEMYLNTTRISGDGKFWVGARDKNSHYEWLTSSKVIPDEFWHQGEPNRSHGDEHCTALHHFSNDNKLLMNDLSCNTNISFICQHIW